MNAAWTIPQWRQHLQSHPEDLKLAYNQASAFAEHNNADAAEKLFQVIVDLQEFVEQWLIGLAYFKLAEFAAARGQRSRAKRMYQECLARVPYHMRALHRLGKIELFRERWQSICQLIDQHASGRAIDERIHEGVHELTIHFERLPDHALDSLLVERLERLFCYVVQMLEKAGEMTLSAQCARIFFELCPVSVPLCHHMQGLARRKPIAPPCAAPILVSVIMANYNQSCYLEESLQSLHRQTYRNLEIIVADDGSSDDSLAKLARWQRYHSDLPLTVVTQSHRGFPARNEAIRRARGELILPLDADDHIAPDYLEKTVAAMQNHPDVGVVFSETVVYGAVNTIWARDLAAIPQIFTRNMVNITALYRRDCWEAAGGYNESQDIYEDWNLWLTLAARGVKFAHIKEPLFFYRRGASTISDSLQKRDLEIRLAMMRLHPDVYRMPAAVELHLLERTRQYIPLCFVRMRKEST